MSNVIQTYNVLMTVQIVAIILTMASTFYIMRQRPSHIQRDLILLQVALIVTLMSYTLQMRATDIGGAIVATKMGYVGRPITVFAMFFLIIDFARIPVKPIIRTISAAIQALFIMIVFTFEQHGLFYKSVRFVNEGMFPHLEKERGPLYYVFIGILLLYCLGMVVTCVVKAMDITCEEDKTLLSLFALIILFPSLGYVLYYMRLTMGYDMSILGTAIGSFIFTIIFRRYDVFSAVNIAWENVFKFTGAGLLVYDRFGKLVYENDMAKEIGVSDRAEELYKSREYIKHEGRVYRVEKLPITGEGRNMGYLYYLDNETNNYNYENRLREEKKRADDASDAKTQFLSSMSHDIRTPMNAILGLTEIARLHIDDTQKVKDSLNKIKTSGEHLIELINEVLDINKIESGKFELMEDDFDLIELIDEIADMNKALIDAKHHTLSIDTEGVKHSFVYADRSRLSQILLNLVSNSIKYTNSGGLITIKVTETKSDPKEAVYKIIVRDNGIGMSEEYLPTLFEPFTRAQDETVTKNQGTGLGMSITKQFIELMGGTVDVRSTLGIGTTFSIIVPLKLADEPSRKISAKNIEEIEKINFSGKRVLVVEDNEVNAEIMGEFLKLTGVEVEFASDGSEAVTKFNTVEDGYYDLIFMDIEMPRMNGYEATKNIRALNRAYAKNVPIVAVTGNAFAEDVKKALDAGMNSHIIKPVVYNKLYEILAEFCTENES